MVGDGEWSTPRGQLSKNISMNKVEVVKAGGGKEDRYKKKAKKENYSTSSHNPPGIQ